MLQNAYTHTTVIILLGGHLFPICADSSITTMYEMCSISDYEMFWIMASIYNPCNAVLHRVKRPFNFRQ